MNIAQDKTKPLPEPLTCIYCHTRPCSNTPVSTFDVCEYGISFYNEGTIVKKKEPFTPLLKLAENIRHEVNPILQVIVQQASKLDPSISLRRIDATNPPSKILAATVVIDELIQMICGVTQFHASPGIGSSDKSKRQLREIVGNYSMIHSLVKDYQSTSNLQFHISISPTTYVSLGVDFIQYMISSLVDNAWKHASPNTVVQVKEMRHDDNCIELSFSNIAPSMRKDIDIFKPGIKGYPERKGFGHGLYWITILIEYYNALFNSETTDKAQLLSISHEETTNSDTIATQTFTLNNIRVEYQL